MASTTKGKGGLSGLTQTTQQQRNELFAGQQPVNEAPIPEQPNYDDKTNQQLVNEAVAIHKATTAAANNALRLVEQSKQVQAATMKELDKQAQIVQDIDDRFHEMHHELTYSERLLNYMRRCCCCWWFDSCTGADPEGAKKRKFAKEVAAGKTVAAMQRLDNKLAERDAADPRKAKQLAEQAAKEQAESGPGHRNPDVRLPSEFRAAELKLHQETATQNEVIDKIGEGLANLLEGAKDMNEELNRQNRALDNLGDKATATTDRLDNVNKNSQLREFRVKATHASQEKAGPSASSVVLKSVAAGIAS